MRERAKRDRRCFGDENGARGETVARAMRHSLGRRDLQSVVAREVGGGVRERGTEVAFINVTLLNRQRSDDWHFGGTKVFTRRMRIELRARCSPFVGFGRDRSLTAYHCQLWSPIPDLLSRPTAELFLGRNPRGTAG